MLSQTAPSEEAKTKVPNNRWTFDWAEVCDMGSSLFSLTLEYCTAGNIESSRSPGRALYTDRRAPGRHTHYACGGSLEELLLHAVAAYSHANGPTVASPMDRRKVVLRSFLKMKMCFFKKSLLP